MNKKNFSSNLAVKLIHKFSIHLALFLILCSNIFSQNTWSALGSGTNGSVFTISISRFGGIYAGGGFTTAGGISALNTARWNGTSWNKMDSNGTLGNTVYALHETNFTLYAGGHFSNKLQKWDPLGQFWLPVPPGFDDDVTSLTSIGSTLYAGGNFSYYGNSRANFIAQMNGGNWSWMDTGFNGSVHALAVIGNNLYAGGVFTRGGGADTLRYNRIAMWNGHWNTLGTGLNNSVLSLAVIGNDLYAGGDFTSAGGVSANHIAKWNGSSWSPLGNGVNGTVYAMAVQGNVLYVGGSFTSAGGITVNNIAKWDGTNWSAMGTGTNNTVFSLCISGNDLFAGGYFTTAGGIQANHIARWGAPLGINLISSELPAQYSLEQNYPNPFNPSTKIKFEVPSRIINGGSSRVKMAVYDAGGKEVAVLVDEELRPGKYEADWNAAGFSSGVYFYRLFVNGFMETRKMILTK